MAHRFTMNAGSGITAEIVLEDGMAYRRLHSDLTPKIMKRNAELRRNPGAVKTTTFGKLELDIPLDHMPVIDRFFPGIANPSHPDHRYQMRRFLKSHASDPYRVQERKKGVNRGPHITC